MRSPDLSKDENKLTIARDTGNLQTVDVVILGVLFGIDRIRIRGGTIKRE